MRGVIVIGTFLVVSMTAFGQGTPEVVEYYVRHDQIGPFFKRWYWHLSGEPTTIWIETLKLTDDRRFEHFTSSTCLPGSTYGTWTREGQVLILKADSVWGNNFMPEPREYRFVINQGRLYYGQDDIRNKNWTMKKVL
jgi:hypothetical protein